MKKAALIVVAAFIGSGCSSDEAPLVEMRAVPAVAGQMSPAEAREVLEEAGFKVEFARPTPYCAPDDALCTRPLDEKALENLVVATQSGTKGKRRPAGSTITLILGSQVSATTEQ